LIWSHVQTAASNLDTRLRDFGCLVGGVNTFGRLSWLQAASCKLLADLIRRPRYLLQWQLEHSLWAMNGGATSQTVLEWHDLWP
jgi:hypothetical protein